MTQRRVDCDVHCTVPRPSELFPYLPAQWAEFMETTEFHGPHAVGMSYPGWTGMFSAGAEPLTLERLRDEVLRDAELAVLHCYYGVESFTHPYYGAAVATAVNRWVAEEWLDREPRLRASLVVTPQHVAQAVEEIERAAADPRFIEVLVPARSNTPYGNQRFWPIWEAADAHGLAVGITYGGGTGSPPSPVNWLSSWWEEYAAATLTFQSHLASLAVSGIFNRCPDLRVVMHESGWTWVPSHLWRLDQEWRAFQREVPWVDGPPSGTIRRHFRFTTAPTDAPPDIEALRETIAALGSDDVLVYGSDFPHAAGQDAASLLEALGPEQAQRVLWQNAHDTYRRLQ